MGDRYQAESRVRHSNCRQQWFPVTTYLMVAILHKRLKLAGTIYRTLQLLSVHPFDKITLNEILTESDHRSSDTAESNQLNLFEL